MDDTGIRHLLVSIGNGKTAWDDECLISNLEKCVRDKTIKENRGTQSRRASFSVGKGNKDRSGRSARYQSPICLEP